MRSVIARVPSRSYDAGSRLRLFKQNALGVFDDGTPTPSGNVPLSPNATPSTWLETGWLTTAWLGEQRYAGWCNAGWLTQDWLAESALVDVLGELHEYGVFQYGVDVIDARGNASSAAAPINVLVNSEPLCPAAQRVSVAAGVVTLSLVNLP